MMDLAKQESLGCTMLMKTFWIKAFPVAFIPQIRDNEVRPFN